MNCTICINDIWLIQIEETVQLMILLRFFKLSILRQICHDKFKLILSFIWTFTIICWILIDIYKIKIATIFIQRIWKLYELQFLYSINPKENLI